MSEHTKGRLVVDGALLRAENDYVVVNKSSRPRLWEGDLRRLAACWNAFENVRTELVELITMQAACDSMEKLPAVQSELDAARALLREMVECNWTLDPFGAIKKHKQAKDYLDACDPLEGAPNAG